MRRAFLAVAVLSLTACSPTTETPAPQSLASAIHRATTSKADLADEAAEKAADDARDEMQGRTYEEVFGEADCTGDCSGHNAGFAWAQENNVEDPSGCEEADGDSFKEGCAAYGQRIAEKSDAARQAVMDGRDPNTPNN